MAKAAVGFHGLQPARQNTYSISFWSDISGTSWDVKFLSEKIDPCSVVITICMNNAPFITDNTNKKILQISVWIASIKSISIRIWSFNWSLLSTFSEIEMIIEAELKWRWPDEHHCIRVSLSIIILTTRLATSYWTNERVWMHLERPWIISRG